MIELDAYRVSAMVKFLIQPINFVHSRTISVYYYCYTWWAMGTKCVCEILFWFISIDKFLWRIHLQLTQADAECPHSVCIYYHYYYWSWEWVDDWRRANMVQCTFSATLNCFRLCFFFLFYWFWSNRWLTTNLSAWMNLIEEIQTQLSHWWCCCPYECNRSTLFDTRMLYYWKEISLKG